MLLKAKPENGVANASETRSSSIRHQQQSSTNTSQACWSNNGGAPSDYNSLKPQRYHQPITTTTTTSSYGGQQQPQYQSKDLQLNVKRPSLGQQHQILNSDLEFNESSNNGGQSHQSSGYLMGQSQQTQQSNGIEEFLMLEQFVITTENKYQLKSTNQQEEEFAFTKESSDSNNNEGISPYKVGDPSSMSPSPQRKQLALVQSQKSIGDLEQDIRNEDTSRESIQQQHQKSIRHQNNDSSLNNTEKVINCPYQNNKNQPKQEKEEQREFLKQQYLKLKQELRELSQKQNTNQKHSINNPSEINQESDGHSASKRRTILQQKDGSRQKEMSPIKSRNTAPQHLEDQITKTQNLLQMNKTLVNSNQSLPNSQSFVQKQTQQQIPQPISKLSKGLDYYGKRMSAQSDARSELISSSLLPQSCRNSNGGALINFSKDKRSLMKTQVQNQKTKVENVVAQPIKKLSTMNYSKINELIHKRQSMQKQGKTQVRIDTHESSSRGGTILNPLSNNSSQKSLQSQLFQGSQNHHQMREERTQSHYLPTQNVIQGRNYGSSSVQSQSSKHLSQHHHCKRSSRHVNRDSSKNPNEDQDYKNSEHHHQTHRHHQHYNDDKYHHRERSKGSITPQNQHKNSCQSNQSSTKKKCSKCMTKKLQSQYSNGRSSQCSMDSFRDSQLSGSSSITPSARGGDKSSRRHKHYDLVGDLPQGSLSPQRLNKELNKILETERMIKEYKEMITKMQRDMYSKKTDTKVKDDKEQETPVTPHTPMNQKEIRQPYTINTKIIQNKKVFQEDVDPVKNLISSNYQRHFKGLQEGRNSNSGGFNSLHKSRTQEKSQNKSKTISLIIETVRDEQYDSSKQYTTYEHLQTEPVRMPKIASISEQLKSHTIQQQYSQTTSHQQQSLNMNKDKTVIPEEDWENTCQINEDDSSLQQQQAILNFYNEFHEEETLRTPSTFSNKASFHTAPQLTFDNSKHGSTSVLAQTQYFNHLNKQEEVKIVSICLKGKKKPPLVGKESDFSKLAESILPKKSPLIAAYQKQHQLKSSMTPTRVSLEGTNSQYLNSKNTYGSLLTKQPLHPSKQPTSFQKPLTQKPTLQPPNKPKPLTSSLLSSTLSPSSTMFQKSSFNNSTLQGSFPNTGYYQTSSSTKHTSSAEHSKKSSLKNSFVPNQQQIKAQTIVDLTQVYNSRNGNNQIQNYHSQGNAKRVTQNMSGSQRGSMSRVEEKTPVAKLNLKLL